MNLLSQFKPKEETLLKWQTKEKQYLTAINQLRAVINHLSNPVFAIEPDGTMTYVSQGAAQLLKKHPNELVGRKFQIILPVEPKDRLRQLYTEFLNKPARLIDEFNVGTLPIQITINPIYNSTTKSFLGGVVELTDITEIKKFEQKQVDFVSYVSHELRTPISSVKGYLDVVIHEADYLNAEHKLYLERAYASNERQAKTVEELISLSDLERGQLSVRLEQTDVINVVNLALVGWQALAKEKGLLLTIKYPKFAMSKAMADTQLLTGVINNLVNNAIKYTENGSITVSVEERNQRIYVAVADTGIGISPEVQASLFAKFVRGERSLTETTQGNGLGLYLSRRFVEQMGGELTLQSEVGKGSVFEFTLPLAD